MNDKYKTVKKNRRGRYVIQSMNEGAGLPFFAPVPLTFRASIMEVPSYDTPKEAMTAWCEAVATAFDVSREKGRSLTGCPVRALFVWEYEEVTTKLTREPVNS